MRARWLTAAIALVVLVAPAGAVADDQIVNTVIDHPNDGCHELAPGDDCTLREAIIAVDQDDEITVPAGYYRLTQGPLPVDVDMQILATAGARATTIDAQGTSRVFDLDGQFAVNVLIRGVTITGGNANAGNTLDPGQGGAIRIVEDGELFLEQSAVVGNTAAVNGGGISNDGDLEVEHSLIAGNTVAGAGGERSGGGIYSAADARLNVWNSTVSGNIVTNQSGPALGGGIYTAERLDLEHATIADNRASDGGGLYLAAGASFDPSMTNTLVADNTGGACGGGDVSTIESDHSLVDDATCALDGVGDLPGGDARLAPLDNYGGPSNTHALYEGSQAIGGSNNCGAPDQRGVVRPTPLCDIGAHEGSITPPPPPPPPPPSPQQLPPPVAGKNVNALPRSGTVKIKLPGASAFVTLAEGRQIPLGTTVDATKGRVRLVAASNKSGGTATADFYDGIFKIGQTKGAKPITTLKLVEKLSCPKRGKASTAAKKKKRKLWGDGKGRFRTEGSYSSATVRGTRWLTEDTCTTTLTRVVRGSVTVRDFVKKKNVIVKAGKKYVARRKP